MFEGFEYMFKGSELKFKAYEHNFLHGKDTILLGYKQIFLAFISFITIINIIFFPTRHGETLHAPHSSIARQAADGRYNHQGI